VHNSLIKSGFLLFNLVVVFSVYLFEISFCFESKGKLLNYFVFKDFFSFSPSNSLKLIIVELIRDCAVRQ